MNVRDFAHFVREYCFIHVCKNDKYKIESQVTSPKLTIAMAAQLLYCCRRSGEKFLSETPVSDHKVTQGYKRAPRKRGMSVNRTFLSKGRANAPDNDKTLRIMIKM